MSDPTTHYISSSVTNVDTDTLSKIIMLPTASTILGIPLIIRDNTGSAGTNNIIVSTQTFDLMDHFASTITLNYGFQSLRVVPFSTTRYSITLNFTEDLLPYIG